VKNQQMRLIAPATPTLRVRDKDKVPKEPQNDVVAPSMPENE
jgi:hypothetical protein